MNYFYFIKGTYRAINARIPGSLIPFTTPFLVELLGYIKVKDTKKRFVSKQALSANVFGKLNMNNNKGVFIHHGGRRGMTDEIIKH